MRMHTLPLTYEPASLLVSLFLALPVALLSCTETLSLTFPETLSETLLETLPETDMRHASSVFDLHLHIV